MFLPTAAVTENSRSKDCVESHACEPKGCSRGEDIGGVAVHIGQRVSALAEPCEILVSSTVKDLVAGSGIQFDDRGEHELKGVPGVWHLYAARP